MSDAQKPKPKTQQTKSTAKHNADRRQFVKQTVVTGLAAAIGVNAARFGKAFAQAAVVARDDQFDYIIVGSGPGGGPLAVNLAAAGFRVLVIEAGGTERPISTLVPAMQAHASEEPSVIWKFYVKYYSDLAQQMRNSKFNKEKSGVLYPRGATLGGSSSVNAMITMYPDNSDWTNLVNLTGSRDFDPLEMRKTFQKLENNHYRIPGWDDQSIVSRNGYQGWLPTSMTPLKFLFRDSNFAALVQAAAREEGLWNELTNKVFNILGADLDPNSWPNVDRGAEGIFTPPKSTEKGVRWGLREHLMDAMKKYPKNLVVKSHTLATRILFADSSEQKAIGVATVSGANLYKADPGAAQNLGAVPTETPYFARKEVILSGGAFNSPQLLMLSGIGDREHLTAMGIPTRVNLPGVGRNLQDRNEIGVVSHLPGSFESLKNCTWGAAGDPCLEDLKEWGNQAIYSSNGVVVGVKKRSSAAQPDPDLFIFAVPGEFKGYYDGWSKNAVKPETYTWAILKGHTKNTSGNVQLQSSHPFDTPEINFRNFEDGKAINGEDMQSVMQAMKIARRINEKMPGGTFETLPGPAAQTDDQLRQFIKDETWGHHASCTNKMGANGLGADNTSLAVVDAQFRVYGTKNLRVVDASVFPKIPGLFIALPIYMMSEKASEIILRDSAKS